MLAKPAAALHKAHLFYEAVRFEHTLFALPFAYIGMFLAADGLPTLSQFIWITVAMVGARTIAMSSNRLIHRKEDAANPRTAGRHLPRGLIKPWEMGALLLVSLGVFCFAASQLNTLSLILAPVAAAYVVAYSYAKYYTWGAHFVLGWADAIAPAGAWIGVAGTLDPKGALLAFAVAMWIGGFDIVYACQDVEFDKRYGVHSIPRRFGVEAAFRWYRGMHLLTSVSLLAVGIWMDLGALYYVGWAVASVLLAYEHTLVKPHDLSKLQLAFFTINSYISATLLLFTALAVTL
jgi:4-hydroxybenzoate polyprenyltransferase